MSNSKDVIRRILESDKADGVKELDLDLDSLPLERALGVQWCIESDCFQFNIVLQDKPCTTRGILSTISSIFDPLGFVTLLLLDGKSILQELCRLNISWDDPIPDDIKIKWEKWRADLLNLQQISISRCYKPENFGPVVPTEPHHFSDASVKGYHQCGYVRMIDEQQRIHCTLVIGKSRVAPLTPVTVPRLELTATVYSGKISQQLRHRLSYHIDQEYFWTDSNVVLGYISNESRRFHVFVANRVQEIQNSTSVEQWNHVESKQNPADEASRGVKSQELLHSRWTNGPAFLWKTEDQWPINQDHSEGTFGLQNKDPEVKKHVTMATTEILKVDSEKTSLCERVKYFSDWYRAKRAIALCTPYTRSLRARVQKKKCKEELTREEKVTDIESAECAIIRAVQISVFKEELDILKQIKRKNPDPNSRVFAQQRKSNIKTYSSLYQLDPFVDDDGILRVSGRLRRASLSDDMKFPIILPRNNHVTTLIVRYFHERTTMTLNEVRLNGFWIISGSLVVSSIISSCVKCKKLPGAVQEQRMSDLPEDRLETAPPFTDCAVDYFCLAVSTCISCLS